METVVRIGNFTKHEKGLLNEGMLNVLSYNVQIIDIVQEINAWTCA